MQIGPQKRDVANRIKLMIIVIVSALLVIITFHSVIEYNESSETITLEFQKDQSIINNTCDIWISKITIPKTVRFEESFVGIVEIVSNNNSDQTVLLESRPGVDMFSNAFFGECKYIYIPRNSTTLVEIGYWIDSYYSSHIQNNTIQTGIGITQDDYCQNFTQRTIYMSGVSFNLTVTKYSYINSIIIFSVILITGYASLKIVDKKLLKDDKSNLHSDEIQKE